VTPGYSLAESALRAKDSISNLFLIFQENEVGCADRKRTEKILLDSHNICHKRLMASMLQILLSKRVSINCSRNMAKYRYERKEDDNNFSYQRDSQNKK